MAEMERDMYSGILVVFKEKRPESEWTSVYSLLYSLYYTILHYTILYYTILYIIKDAVPPGCCGASPDADRDSPVMTNPPTVFSVFLLSPCFLISVRPACL